MGIRPTGTRAFCNGCAVGKGIRKATSKTTSSTARPIFQRLSVDLTGPNAPSAAGSRYCLCCVDDCSNFGIVKFLPDKTAETVASALREILVSLKPLRDVHGDFEVLRTDNGTELVNSVVDALLLEFGISRELTSPDGGQKRNGKVERRIGLIREGARAALEEAVLLFPDVEFPARALNWGLIWPEAWKWMSDVINIMARLDQEPDMLCPYELMYGKRPLRAPLPFLMPGFHHVRRQSKMEAKGEACQGA